MNTLSPLGFRANPINTNKNITFAARRPRISVPKVDTGKKGTPHKTAPRKGKPKLTLAEQIKQLKKQIRELKGQLRLDVALLDSLLQTNSNLKKAWENNVKLIMDLQQALLRMVAEKRTGILRRHIANDNGRLLPPSKKN